MGSHDPFGHLKQKLWPKKRLGIKLAVWLPTTKSWESTWFPHVHVMHNIPLKRSRQGLQLRFRPHRNRRFACKVMGPQSRRNPNCGQNAIWLWVSWRGTWYTIRGKVVASPKSGWLWVLWVRGCSWLVLTQKMLKLCTNQLVVWFVLICVSD
jgi:hypothetical protein